MKTLGRILIILAMFALVMGVTYAVVNAGGASSSGAPFENGTRPEFRDGARAGFDGQFEGGREGGGSGLGLAFGLVKNLGIVAIITALIAVPRNWMKTRKPVQVTAG